MEAQSQSPYMNAAECARHLRVALQTVRNWTHSKKIPSRKHGRRRVYYRPEIDEWSASRSTQPVEPMLCRFESAMARRRSLTTEDTLRPRSA